MDKKTVFGINKSKGASEQQPKRYRSPSFEQQFEGYTHHVELTEQGKKRIVRTYTGDYYESALTSSMLLLRKLIYLILYGISMGMLVLYGQYGYQSPWAKLLVLPEMGTLFSLLWAGLKLVFYMTAPRKMTVGEYKSSCTAFRNASKWAAVLWTVTAFLFLLSSVFTGSKLSLWLCPFLMLLAGSFSAALLYFLEARVNYITTSFG